MKQLLNRRLFSAALLAGTGALAVQRMRTSGLVPDRRKPQSRVAILHVVSYAASLEARIADGLRLFGLDLRGKTVLLKPNLVEYIPGAEVNTSPLLVGAAAGAFLAMGAAKVVVGEGPGHQRDTYLVIAENGLEEQLRERRLEFVDLNRDEIIQVPLKTRFTGMETLWFPRTVLTADFIVPMPKVKTHHFAGVTLSMKNMFGVIPGAAYGWPKKRTALERYRSQHSRHQRGPADRFRHRGRHRGHGGEWPAAWTAPAARAGCAFRRSGRRGLHLHAVDGFESLAGSTFGASCSIPRKRRNRTN